MTFQREIEAAKLLAQEAGAMALDYQRRGVRAELKSDESPVTSADRACEKLIVDRLERRISRRRGARRGGSKSRRSQWP